MSRPGRARRDSGTNGVAPQVTVVIDPARFDAVILDMDGVVTDTARTHGTAWSQLFDEYLADGAPAGADTAPFTTDDYRTHVDGRARIDGIESFLASRGVSPARGTPTDPPGATTSWGLANRKNELFLTALDRSPPQAFPSTVRLLDALAVAGMPTAVVTASRNRDEVLAAAGLTDRFDAHVDGNDAAEMTLEGKPAPDMFLEAARRLGVGSQRTLVIEDAAAGVEAGRQGGFGLVIGVDRTGHPDDLLSAGADVTVADLAEVAVAETGTVGRDARAPGPGDSPEWWYTAGEFTPSDEGRREALYTLGNGVFATRGADPEARADGVHYPGTYAAGVYNRLVSQVEDREVEHESLVNLPNWLPLSFRPVDGVWLDLSTFGVEDHEQRLDLRRGVLHRRMTVVDDRGRTTRVAERRLVHTATPHLAALEWTITPLNWSGTLEIRSGVAGDVENRNVTAEHDLAGRHLTDVRTGTDGAERVWVNARTTRTERHVTVAARTRLFDGAALLDLPRRTVDEAGRIDQNVEVAVAAGHSLTVEKVAAVTTSMDHAIADTHSAALGWLGDAGSVEEMAVTQENAWERLWQRAHLELRSDDPAVARTLNLHTFHVLQTLSPHIVDRDVGVPARGLTGEGYRGHVFWDELFVFPYLNIRFPALTRELLLYRYRRLPAARRQAGAMGCRGARFPWQSGSDGREETPTEFFNPRSGRWMPDNSQRQHHVSLAIAYEVWQYHQVTGDDDFLIAYGAELLTEIARFWTDMAEHDPVTGRHHIRGVMGPDEFHDGYPDRPGGGIDDNAYTNILVSWLLQRAVDTHRRLNRQAPDARGRLDVTDDELARWDRLSRRLHVPFHGDGIISQFAGYEELDELDWDLYRSRYGDVGRLDLILEAEGDTTNRYKAAKQADVLMLLYLFSADELTELLTHLGYDFDPAGIPRMVDYYITRLTKGSTLCRVVMTWVLARLDRARSWDVFREALTSDVADIQGGTTREGIHLGAMAGTIDIVQRCYTGLETRGDTLWFDPRLPGELDCLTFEFSYRGRRIAAVITDTRIELTAASETGGTGPVRIRVADRLVDLPPGQRVVVDLSDPQATVRYSSIGAS